MLQENGLAKELLIKLRDRKKAMQKDVMPSLDEFTSLPRFPDGRINYTGAKKAAVLLCAVKHDDKILLLKRSDKVGNYRGKWNLVAGFLDQPRPVREKVLEEIREELGLSEEQINDITVGEPF